MTLVLLVLLAILSLTVACVAWAARAQATRFIRIEDVWRERERQLVDRLLRQAHVPPLEIQREQVLKIPDPELAPTAETWVDQAWLRDSIKEEIEQIYPVTRSMSEIDVMHVYASDWRAIERRLKEEQTPLRVS